MPWGFFLLWNVMTPRSEMCYRQAWGHFRPPPTTKGGIGSLGGTLRKPVSSSVWFVGGALRLALRPCSGLVGPAYELGSVSLYPPIGACNPSPGCLSPSSLHANLAVVRLPFGINFCSWPPVLGFLACFGKAHWASYGRSWSPKVGPPFWPGPKAKGGSNFQ